MSSTCLQKWAGGWDCTRIRHTSRHGTVLQICSGQQKNMAATGCAESQWMMDPLTFVSQFLNVSGGIKILI